MLLSQLNRWRCDAVVNGAEERNLGLSLATVHEKKLVGEARQSEELVTRYPVAKRVLPSCSQGDVLLGLIHHKVVDGDGIVEEEDTGPDGHAFSFSDSNKELCRLFPHLLSVRGFELLVVSNGECFVVKLAPQQMIWWKKSAKNQQCGLSSKKTNNAG